jgi:hypothetical protein
MLGLFSRPNSHSAIGAVINFAKRRQIIAPVIFDLFFLSHAFKFSILFIIIYLYLLKMRQIETVYKVLTQ